MVVIVVDEISPRINYTFKQVFELFLNVQYKVVVNSTDEKNNFILNYSTRKFENANLNIVPSGLLNEAGIKNVIPSFSQDKDEVKLFLNDSEKFGFDFFSAIFWMITRYEEHNSSEFDNHNRFPAKNSFAFKNNFLEIPVVDVWVNELAKIIGQVLPGFIPNQQFSILNTIDVDNAFAYKGKDFARKIGAFSRDLLKGKLAENKKRRDVLTGNETDPYDTYEYIKAQTHSKNIETIFFHLVGEKAKHDRNIKVDSAEYKKLLGELKVWSKQGLHPSYASNSIDGRIKEEKSWLEKSVEVSVNSSRQHFLMMRFPKTYADLVQAGITNDYSMGFADEIGFRAGTSRSFYFFNLQSNQEMPLLVHPFCLMDGTLRDYLKLGIEESKTRIIKMVQLLKKMNLRYIAIWHNETLSETNGWEGWRAVYEAQFI